MADHAKTARRGKSRVGGGTQAAALRKARNLPTRGSTTRTGSRQKQLYKP